MTTGSITVESRDGEASLASRVGRDSEESRESLQPARDADALSSLETVSKELNKSYRDLQAQVVALRAELTISRQARLRELAEKERLLARLSSLLAALPGGVVIVDGEKTISDANPAALAMLGEPLLGETWPAVSKRNPELRGTRDGDRQLSVSSRPLLNDGEQVVLITDTTEIHELQEQLGRRHRLAALGEMAARLAHQIRTPLSAATLYLAQLGRHDLPPEQRDHICRRVSDRLQHTEALIESMLSFVRGRSPVMTTLLLRDVLTTLDATVRPTLPEATTLSITPVDDTLQLHGCADDLVGALTNLVVNALEIAGDTVRVDIWAGARNRDWLQVRIRDNGPGIDDGDLPRIFDPFFTTRVGGTGLGLAVVAMTIGNHGGQVRARNCIGGGAEFLLDLPLLAVQAQPKEVAA